MTVNVSTHSAVLSSLQERVQGFLKARHALMPVPVSRLTRLARESDPLFVFPDGVIADLAIRHALARGHSIHFDGKEAWQEFLLAS